MRVQFPSRPPIQETSMVYIVICNGRIDLVFSNRAAADAHAKQLNKRWSFTEIIEREILEI
jgi:hypothetical protein